MLLMDVRTLSSWGARPEVIMLALAGGSSSCLQYPIEHDGASNRLISASVQNVVFYGFKCKPTELRLYTALCMMTGLAGSVVPFMSWFDERRNKVFFRLPSSHRFLSWAS